VASYESSWNHLGSLAHPVLNGIDSSYELLQDGSDVGSRPLDLYPTQEDLMSWGGIEKSQQNDIQAFEYDLPAMLPTIGQGDKEQDTLCFGLVRVKYLLYVDPQC
jgi:hypothetical protein